MNIDEVKRTIHQGSLAAKEAKKILVKVGAEAAEAEQLARLTLHDSQDDDAQAGLTILGDFGREIDLTVHRIDAAVEHADAYLATLG